MKLQIPDELDCVGGSTGRVCVVRCRNAAFAGRESFTLPDSCTRRLTDCLAFGGCAPVSQKDAAGRTDNTPEGVKTRGKIAAIERQKVEAQAQLGAMKLTTLVGVVEPQIAVRQKDGLMQMMPGQVVPAGHVAEKTSPAFIPVNAVKQ